MAYGTSYENFYDGGVTSLSPEYGNFTGYRMTANQLGFPGSAQTANQLGETVNALKQGVKAFEVTLVMPDTAEVIPKQHFKEMRALMKLSGVKPSVHGPVVDASGFTEKGWGGDITRADNERRMFDAIEKAKIIDPKGNIPIVFHSTNGIPGMEYVPGDEKKGEKRFEPEKTFAINQETKQMAPLEKEYKYRPGKVSTLDANEGKGKLFSLPAQLNSINTTEWENKMTELATFNKHADEVIGPSAISLREKYQNAIALKDGFYEYDERGMPTKKLDDPNDRQKSDYNRMKKADIFLDNVELNFNSAFHKAYKYGTGKQKDMLRELANNYEKAQGSLHPDAVLNPFFKREILSGAIENLQEITKERRIIRNGRAIEDEDYGAPKIFMEVEDFAKDKAATTFGNLAMRSYKEYGDKAPVIAIENMYQGMAFSKADDLRELVEKSRDKFASQLIKEKGLTESEAKEAAEKHLGVTWDVGHLNIMKKKGFTDKDVVEETKKIRPLVKHIHLTDNFGFGDSHLAPGMGNVPFKEIMTELEKNGDFKSMRKIVEAPGFVQHFKKSPHPSTMSAFGSGIYSMKQGPTWNQAMDIVGPYFAGYGTVDPQQHHSMYGSGFTTMPVEFGGMMPGAGGQSRFGGTPMA